MGFFWFIPSLFTLFVVFAAILAFAFVTLCLATGLYYLAELVEEYTILTKKVLHWSIFVVVSWHCLLWVFEDLPLLEVLIGVGAHLWYYMLLEPFPFVQLFTTKFIGACVLLALDHFMWFRFFTSFGMNFEILLAITIQFLHRVYHPFNQVVSFFLICVWLVPFGFFISLSANEETLPPTGTSNTAASSPGWHGDGLRHKSGAVPSGAEDSNVLDILNRPTRMNRSLNRVLQLFGWFGQKRETILPSRAAKKV